MRLKYIQLASLIVMLSFVIFSTNCQSDKNKQKTKAGNTQQQIYAGESSTTVHFDFEAMPQGDLPDTWEAVVTGKGTLGSWKILRDKNESGLTNVLAQTSMENFGGHFDVVVAKQTSFRDITLSVKFKAIKGKEDQGGGPVWRYIDANNYYIARANPLENNYRFYKVVDGNRRQIATYSLPVTSGEWHTLKIEHVGTKIKCYYDGQLFLEAEDDTFMQHGKIGVWTKADSYCYFDDLIVEEKECTMNSDSTER